ncbi:DedA family protein [Actinokineospora soli]|uniref:DedA family protein n=1 Tax=Actinokineospora soli TaxID=1048753 RepID=A0ABW2TYF2_9PSEU
MTLATGVLDSAGPLLVWAIVLGFVFVECAFIFGLFLPGDTLLFAAGVVLAQQGAEGQAWALCVAATVTAVAANQVGYFIGAKTGHAIITRKGGRVLNAANLAKARDFLDRRGFWAVVLARWLPWVRTLAPLIAGAAKMDARKFATATTVGALAWVPTLVLLGYYAAGLLDRIPWLQTAVVVGSVAFFVLGTGWGIWKYRQEMRKPVDTISVTE